MFSSQQSYSMKENIASLLAWSNLYTILIVVVLMAYLFFFSILDLTGIFTNAPNQIDGIPYLGWQIPTIILIVFSLVFSQDPNESYTLPLCAFGLIVMLCNGVCLIRSATSLSQCIVSPNVACDFLRAMLLVMAIVLIFLFFILAFLITVIYVRYSVCIRDNVDFVIAKAKEEEKERKKVRALQEIEDQHQTDDNNKDNTAEDSEQVPSETLFRPASYKM